MKFRIIEKNGEFQVQKKAFFFWTPAILEFDEGDWWALWHKSAEEARKAYEEIYETPKKPDYNVVCWWNK